MHQRISTKNRIRRTPKATIVAPPTSSLCAHARSAAQALDAASAPTAPLSSSTTTSSSSKRGDNDATSALLLLDSDIGRVLHVASNAPPRFLKEWPLGVGAGLVLTPNDGSSWSDVLHVGNGATTATDATLCSSSDLENLDGPVAHVRVLSATDLGPCPCADLERRRCQHGPLLVARAARADDERRAALTAEWERYDRMRSYVDASFDPMFAVDSAGTIVMVNDAALTTFGYTRDELMGSNVSVICGGDHGPRHQDYIRRYLKTGVSKIMGTQREVPARRKDGSEFPVELGIKEIRSDDDDDGSDEHVIFAAFVKDLTRRKSHERQLVRQESLTKGMIDASFDPMLQIDVRGIIHVVNQATVALFGYSRDELLGNNVSMICGEEHAARHDEYIQRYLQTGVKRIVGRKRNVRAKRKDGAEFDIELYVQEVLTDVPEIGRFTADGVGSSSSGVVVGGEGNGMGERMFCGYVRDMTRTNLDRQRIRDNHRLITGKFFSEDGTGG